MDSDTNGCRLCGSENLNLLVDLGDTPIAHRMLEAPSESEFRHPMHIDYCRDCGLGQILDPIDPEVLYRDYNYCFTSWKPEPHRPVELELLSGEYAGSSVFEIGSNDGLFLEELAGVGYRRCVGLEPNRIATEAARARGFEVYEEFLSDDLIGQVLQDHERFDVVVSRQVLEHVHDIDLFFRFAREILVDGGRLFVDVPDVEPGLRVGDCTIAWEEHVNYFTEKTLDRAFRQNGFRPVDFRKFNFSGGCLSILAVKEDCHPAASSPGELTIFETFGEKVMAYQELAGKTLALGKEKLGQVLLYGSGCRACTFVNGLKLGSLIDSVVDDQEERQGKYLPGAQLLIESPAEHLKAGGKGLVLLAVNQENEQKVVARAIENGGGDGFLFVSLLGPNDIFAEIEKALNQLKSE